MVKKEQSQTNDDQGKFTRPREDTQFCQAPSDQYMQELEEAGGDPRLVLSRRAIRESRKRGGAWVPTWDARDRRLEEGQ